MCSRYCKHKKDGELAKKGIGKKELMEEIKTWNDDIMSAKAS
jgi:hypothetical protein